MRDPAFLCFQAATRLSAVLVPAGVCVLLGYLFWHGLPVLGLDLLFAGTDPLQAMLGRVPVWDGLWNACAGTCRLVLLTVALAIFPGVGCGLYLAALATPRQRHVLGAAVDMLAGMPSIVMGLFGFMLILFLRRTVFPQANTGLLLAAACLALLVLPVLISSTREGVLSLPHSLWISAAALGMSRVQTLLRLSLPTALPGIFGGVVLAVGRAAEDTAVILFTGVVADAGLAAGLLDKFEALSFEIYYISAQYQDQEELLRGFGAAVFLLLVSCALLGVSCLLERSFRRRWQGRAGI